jgi:hypothetical protein
MSLAPKHSDTANSLNKLRHCLGSTLAGATRRRFLPDEINRWPVQTDEIETISHFGTTYSCSMDLQGAMRQSPVSTAEPQYHATMGGKNKVDVLASRPLAPYLEEPII